MHPLTNLLIALGTSDACFVLGAGASWPHVPTTGQMPDRFRQFAPRITSFPASKQPDFPIRHLMDPIAVDVLNTMEGLGNWKMHHWTADTIAVVLEQTIACAHKVNPPQYRVFQLFARRAPVVSFNWDGLARRFCPQHTVVHPHGCVIPRTLTQAELQERLFWTQLSESSDGKWWLGHSLVMIGEEAGDQIMSVRNKVSNLWRRSSSVVLIGYSFGIDTLLDYDRIWRDLFADALRLNPVPIHIISPDAEHMREALSELISRSTDVVAWPLSWYALSRALLTHAQDHGYTRITQFIGDAAALQRRYERMAGE